MQIFTNIMRQPLSRKVLRAAAVFLALLLLCVLYVAFIGITIDASDRRAEIVQKFMAATGREAKLEGALQFIISAHPALHVSGLHIANTDGIDGVDFASLGDARLELDLWALLLGHVKIEELSGNAVHLSLQANRAGNNWTFHTGGQPATQTTSDKPTQGTSIGHVLALLDIQRISLRELEVDYTGVDGKPHYFVLDDLSARLPAGAPVTLKLNGKIEKKYPYTLDFTGGTLQALADTNANWPVSLELGFMSSRLSLKGNVSGDDGKLDFRIGTEHIKDFDRLLQTPIPALGKVELSGTVSYAPGSAALENLAGTVGQSKLKGKLNLAYGGERTRVQGELDMPVLDLRPFITGKPVAEEDKPPKSLSELYEEISKATFNLKQLKEVDADLTLRVGEWRSLPGAVRDAKLQVKLQQGKLTVPMQVTASGVTLAGNVSADANAKPARVNLVLAARHASVNEEPRDSAELPSVQGHLDRFDLGLSGRGDTGAQLMKALDVSLGIEGGKLSYGDSAHGRRVQFTLDKFAVTLPAGKPLQGEMHGSLLQKPFGATLRGGTLAEIMQESNTSIDFFLQAGSAKAEVHALLRPPTESSGSEMRFQLAAPHASEVAEWLGLRPGADAPVNLKGDWHVRRGGWQLPGLTLQIGRSALSVALQRTRTQGKPLTRFALTSELIDLDELQSLLPEKKEGEKPVSKPASTNPIDIPILPANISLADADIRVDIKQIATSSPFVVRDLHFDGQVRDGMMGKAPFAVSVAKTAFSGAILLDLRTQQPHVQLLLDAAAMDIGHVLNKLGVAKGLDAAVDQVKLQLDLHASHLGELLANSDMSIAFTGGHYVLRDANTGGTMRINIDQGELKSAAGAPVRLGLNGALDAVPVTISIETATATELLDPAKSIPFKLDAAAAGATLDLAGKVDRPLSQKDVELALELRGARFDNLNALVHASLPPWGPWSASGKFYMTAGGYEVSNLLLQVGSSALQGDGTLDTRASPPRLDIVLKADTIQLDDFRFGNWSPEGKKPAVPVRSETDEEKHKRKTAQKQQAEHLLSKEVLRRQDAYLTVRVEEVISGKDALGKGKLDAKLEHGHAEIGPMVVDTPGGSAQFKLDYEPADKDVALRFVASANRFDYGILARRADPKSKLSGQFDLDVDVSAQAPSLEQLMRFGKGHINFALWPENMESGVLDIWAVNILMSLLPVLDSSKASKVNCAIGQFELADGKLADKILVVDTSRMRVTGRGGADFSNEKVNLYMQPRAKTPQFLSLAVPVEVGGTFNDFSIGVRAGDVVSTLGEFLTSFILTPLKSLFEKEVPEDGRDICGNPRFK